MKNYKIKRRVIMILFEGRKHIFNVEDVVRVERSISRKGYEIVLKNGETISLSTFEKNKLINMMKERKGDKDND
jgi:uncharacterized protein YcgL (UPF0745 family)